MKRIAILLAFLLLLSMLAACGGSGGAASGSDPEPSGEAEPSQAVGTGENGEPMGGTSSSEVDTPDDSDGNIENGGETEAPPEEIPFLTVTANGSSVIPQTCLYREDSLGSGVGGEAMLPIIGSRLPVLSYGEDLSLSFKDGGALIHVKAFDLSYAQNADASGIDVSALSSLEKGLWYVIVGASWQNAELAVTDCYEFAFMLSVDTKLYVTDGGTPVYPLEVAVGSEVYDETSGAWTITLGTGAEASLQELAPELPELYVSENLAYRVLGSASMISLAVYNENYLPVTIDGGDFSALSSQLQPGTWYMVLRITWEGDYIEAEDRYESETVDYVFKLIA